MSNGEVRNDSCECKGIDTCVLESYYDEVVTITECPFEMPIWSYSLISLGVFAAIIIGCGFAAKAKRQGAAAIGTVQIIPTNVSVNPQPVQMQTVTFGGQVAGQPQQMQNVQVQSVPQQVQVFGANGQQQAVVQQQAVAAGPTQATTVVVGGVTSTGESQQQTIML